MKMFDRCERVVPSVLFGCLACLVVTSGANSDRRVFVLDLGNSSGLQGFREAERACDSLNARLASLVELRHAVEECLFSTCTSGWLYGGAVGTTVCHVVGGALKAVDVRVENATADSFLRLEAFCVKDKGMPCGDPPSFPNARLQGHSGYQMGDELLYMCAPGYATPSGHRAFSLMCDSCGGWYGLVEVCVKGETEHHMDYEDKLTNSYGKAEPHNRRPEEAHGEVYEEVRGAVYPGAKTSQEQHETSFDVQVEEERQHRHKDLEVLGEVTARKFEGGAEGGEEEDHAAEDFRGHPRLEQERWEVITVGAAATTEAPDSLLSQKHQFWFPSEAFSDEGHPVSANPVAQATQRVSGIQSEESKENESQEKSQHQHPKDIDDYRHDTGDDLDDQDDINHHSDQEDLDSHQDEDDHDDQKKHYIPAQRDELHGRGRHEIHDGDDDLYDVGEHEENRGQIRYDNHDHDDRDDSHDQLERREDEDGDTEDHLDGSQEHPDSDSHDDNVKEHYGPEEVDNDSYTKQHDHRDHDDPDDPDDHDDDHHDVSNDHDDADDPDDLDDHDDADRLDHDNHNDHDDHFDYDDPDDHDDHLDHDDREHDSHDSYEVHDSREDIDDSHQHVILSVALDKHQNTTQKGGGLKTTTDETWLDGYPVVPAGTGNSDSPTVAGRPGGTGRGAVIRITEQPNEVAIRSPAPYTSSPEVDEAQTTELVLAQDGVEEVWPGLIPAAGPSFDKPHPLDYDTQQAAPTPSWLDDLPEHPLMGSDQAPTGRKGGILVEDHTIHHLPGESGERGEMAGEVGGTICTGEDCPPPTSPSRGPKVAAIIVVVCAVMAAVIIGVWCYRRQQQKSSMYEMNGKGQSQTTQGQQIEMQQKV